MKSILQVACAATLAVASTLALAQDVIINPAGTLAMGVNPEGHLNTSVNNVAVNDPATGLAFLFPDGLFYDATSPGCECEGWGVSFNESVSGYASVDNPGGVTNLTVESFTVTASTAESVVTLTSNPEFRITHLYEPAANAPAQLFRVAVRIENNSTETVSNVRYVRAIDWDIPPTEFDELVSIQGTQTTTLLAFSHDNGFVRPDPLNIDARTDFIQSGTLNQDFVDSRADHGAYFHFNFGDIGPGEAYEFDTFYGAASTENAIVSALALESVELYSVGKCTPASDTTGQCTSEGAPATFAFGFRGVGGTPVPPPPPPFTPMAVPTLSHLALLLMMLLLGGLAVLRLRGA